MAGKKQPYGINNVVSWGATVVIVGLLFKIQHWPNGGLFISIGLGMEAFLFLILGFQREGEELDWVKAYPELAHDYAGELSKTPKAIDKGNTAALDKMLADAKIGPELISSLGDGLRTFGDKVSTISQVADAGMLQAMINWPILSKKLQTTCQKWLIQMLIQRPIMTR
jgi:gliding motility-associated protein GldL